LIFFCVVEAKHNECIPKSSGSQVKINYVRHEEEEENKLKRSMVHKRKDYIFIKHYKDIERHNSSYY
jgi:hypothetical protein